MREMLRPHEGQTRSFRGIKVKRAKNGRYLFTRVVDTGSGQLLAGHVWLDIPRYIRSFAPFRRGRQRMLEFDAQVVKYKRKRRGDGSDFGLRFPVRFREVREP
jgi:hypothetical protein